VKTRHVRHIRAGIHAAHNAMDFGNALAKLVHANILPAEVANAVFLDFIADDTKGKHKLHKRACEHVFVSVNRHTERQAARA
jgi:hypothetical protein